MVERIRQILQTRQLSPTQFADALGLARPIISHVLSGRNKPSLEVVQKIIAAFPDISLPWLLSGQGPMLAAEASQPATPAPAAPEVVAAPQGPVPETASQRPKRAVARTPEATAPAAAPPPVQSVAAAPPPPLYAAPTPESIEAPRLVPPAVEAHLTPAPAVAVAAPQNAPQAPAASAPASPDLLSAFAEPGKTIRRIVIFYHDGTFSAYQPETPN